MKRWRRSPKSASTATTAVAVHVTSVETDGTTNVIWHFDSNPTVEGTAGGFDINGELPTASLGLSGDHVTYIYLSNHDVGEPWTMTAAACPGWTFANGGTLVDGAGTT